MIGVGFAVRLCGILLILLHLTSPQGQCQTPGHLHIGIKWMGLAAHLKRGQNVHLYRQKLDKNGYLALTQGLVIGLEFKVNPLLAIRLNQALIPSDCAGKFLGVTQLGLSLWQSFDHSRQYVGATLGPVWFYRHAWTALPQYRDDGLFELKGNTRQWQTKFVWHGLDLGYRLALHDRGGFELNCMPGLPEVCTFSPGAYWQAL